MSLEEAWAELHGATPSGWFVGPPSYEPHRLVPWSQYAFDTTERPRAGQRSRDRTATAMSEEGVVREMARCLAEIGAGRVPK